MDISIKKINYDWESFLIEWGRQFSDAKQILTYLNSYTKYLKPLRIKQPNTAINIENTQKEWLWLLSKLEHPDDINFFEPFWVMIEGSEYDTFMDLSDPKYPIFQGKYYNFIKPSWCKLVLFPDVSEFLLMIDDEQQLAKMVKQAWDQHYNFLALNEIENEVGE